ncbi:hypothetical protein BH09ACT12_BH09ACT12_08850 [soil metagenome]
MSMTDPGANADLTGVTELGDELLRLQRRRSSVYEGVVLDNSAFRLLWVLADGTPRTLRQLTEALGLEQSTVNRQVNAALGAGYLERFAVEGSASKLVRPSAAGVQAYDHDGRIRAELMSRALADLGPVRTARLIEDLQAFNDALDTVLAAAEPAGDPGDTPRESPAPG